MEDLEQLIKDYGNVLSISQIANILDVDVRTARKYTTNHPRMKTLKQFKILTTNFYFWELAEGNDYLYNKYKLEYVKERK